MLTREMKDSRALLVLVLICLSISTFSLLLLSRDADASDRTWSAIQALPVSHRDSAESKSDQSRRLSLLRSSINKATPYDWERKLLVAVAWHESRFYSKVQRCQMAGDNGKAHGPWQTWRTRCPAHLDRFASEAIRHLRSAMHYCKGATLEDRIRRGVSLYATGNRCEWVGASKRVRTWRKIRML